MDLDCFTLLFGDWKIVYAESGRSSYGHTFGGPHDRAGASREDCHGVLIHLLHRLDLQDPAIPITIPGVRWLPLYYCFDDRANELGYKLLSDDSMVTFFPDDEPRLTNEESWPDEDGYPLEFPRSDINVSLGNYDPTDLDEAYLWAGVFGIEKLSPQDQAIAKQRAYDEMMDMDPLELPAPDEEPDEECDKYIAESIDEHLTGVMFPQGKPNSRCINPECPNHAIEGTMSVIVIMSAEPVQGVHTFGQYGGSVELIFELCPECYTIRVSNQCT